MSGIGVFLSLLAGVALGLFFYGGLWITVQRLASSAHPVLLTLGSFWTRVIVVAAAFVFLARASLEYVAIAMLSFILSRLAVPRLVSERRPAAKCT